MNEVAVQGCTVEAGLDVEGAFISSGACSIITPPSTTNKINNKGVYKGIIQVQVSGYSDANISNGATTTPGTITGGSLHYKADGSLVILKGDKGSAVLTGVHPSSGEPVTGYNVDLKVTAAGQTVVKAD